MNSRIERLLAMLAGLSLLLPSAGPAHAAAPDACELARTIDAGSTMRVPFDTVDGRIYVQARVDGQGPFRFAIDTGASGMGRADASLVASLGLAVHGETTTSDGVDTSRVETVRLASLELGGLERKDVEVITRDYAKLMSKDAPFAGILARDFFGDGLLAIDFPRKTLHFTRTLELAPTARGALAYEKPFRIPVTIDEVQAIGQLDTGANVAFVLPAALHAQVASEAATHAGNARLTNGTVAVQRATVAGPFRVGELELADVEVRVSADYPELLVGAHALQEAVVLIDQRHQTVAICHP